MPRLASEAWTNCWASALSSAASAQNGRARRTFAASIEEPRPVTGGAHAGRAGFRGGEGRPVAPAGGTRKSAAAAPEAAASTTSLELMLRVVKSSRTRAYGCAGGNANVRLHDLSAP